MKSLQILRKTKMMEERLRILAVTSLVLFGFVFSASKFRIVEKIPNNRM